MNILSKLYVIYIVLYTEYFTASLIIISWNVISHILESFVLTKSILNKIVLTKVKL